MDKASWDKVKWRLIGNHPGYSKEGLALFKANVMQAPGGPTGDASRRAGKLRAGSFELPEK